MPTTARTFVIKTAASTLGGEADMTPFFIDHGAHPRQPLSATNANHAAHESTGQYAQWMRSIEASERELLATTQAASKGEARRGPGQYRVQGGRPCATPEPDQGAATRSKSLSRMMLIIPSDPIDSD